MRQQTLPKTLPAFLWHFLSPYRNILIMMVLTGVIWGIQMSSSPYVLKLIIDSLSHYTGDKLSIFSEIKSYIFLYLLVILLGALNLRLFDLLYMHLLPKIRANIVSSMFDYLVHHSFSFFQGNFGGSLANKISDMSSGVVTMFGIFEEVISNASTLVIAMIIMCTIHPIFAAVLLVWVIVFISFSLYFSKYIHRLSDLLSESKTRFIGKLVDAISNSLNILLFARTRYEIDLIKRSAAIVGKRDRKAFWYIIKLRTMQDISMVLLIAAMMASLIYMYSRDLISIGDFIFILSVSHSIFYSIWNVARQFVVFSEHLGRCSQALRIINIPHEIVDDPKAEDFKPKHGKIEFKNVKFKYEKNNNIFENVSITIQPGQKVGLVGFSGSGKTTFARLILRFFNINAGSIFIDDQNISHVKQELLRASISMIPQEPVLFHRTLMENIRYGRLDATDEEVIKASKKAHCHEFISQIKEQYKSLVGERGIKLSGGQRQRIAIARAILKDAPILILDEATSALDSVTEGYIQESLHYLMKNRTTIIIAHRLSTLAEMDRILVFDNGHIVEDGTHRQLLLANGQYAKMWKTQIGGFLSDETEDDITDTEEAGE